MASTTGWTNARGKPPLKRWMLISERNTAAAIQGPGRQSVCSRVIRNTSQAEIAISEIPSTSPNVIGPVNSTASRNRFT